MNTKKKILTVYKVGGCVRDKLLGLNHTDTDYVVIGSSVEEMLNLGFKPIGKDFPVFLHPITHEQYALARSEKKTGVGYKGFTFQTSKNITLLEDLKRRDITINAMAEDNEGNIIDPFNGQQDLKNKIIRHVSTAFIDDPLRVLRVARFSAILNFTIASETFELLSYIANKTNELKYLSQERINIELTKAVHGDIIMFFTILKDCGALNSILKDFNIIFTNANIYSFIKKAWSNQNISKLNQNHRLVILYFSIYINEPFENALSKINILQIPKKLKILLMTIINFYHKIEISQKNNLKKLSNNLFELTILINKKKYPTNYNELINLIQFIALIDDKSSTIKEILNFISTLEDLFKNIDYDALLNLSDLYKVGYNSQFNIIKTKKIQIILEVLLNNSLLLKIFNVEE